MASIHQDLLEIDFDDLPSSEPSAPMHHGLPTIFQEDEDGENPPVSLDPSDRQLRRDMYTGLPEVLYDEEDVDAVERCVAEKEDGDTTTESGIVPIATNRRDDHGNEGGDYQSPPAFFSSGTPFGAPSDDGNAEEVSCCEQSHFLCMYAR